MDLARVILLKSLAITVALTAITALLVSRDAAVALLAGGILAIVNFRLSSRLLSKAVTPGMDPGAGSATVITASLFRYTLLGFVLLTIIRSGINPVFLVIGLSAVVGAVFISFKDIKGAVA